MCKCTPIVAGGMALLVYYTCCPGNLSMFGLPVSYAVSADAATSAATWHQLAHPQQNDSLAICCLDQQHWIWIFVEVFSFSILLDHTGNWDVPWQYRCMEGAMFTLTLSLHCKHPEPQLWVAWVAILCVAHQQTLAGSGTTVLHWTCRCKFIGYPSRV